MIVSSIVVFAFIGLVSSAEAVPLTKCAPDDSKCIKQNSEVLIPLFAAGIPELGIEPLDPLVFKKIDSSTSFLNLVFRDLSVKGLRTCRFKSIKRNVEKQVISAKIHCDVVLDGKYDMKGNILTLPIHGQGNAHIEHEKIEITFDLQYTDETGADGKKHWKAGSWTQDFKYVGKTTLDFDNLFGGGDNVLAQAAMDLMKNNAKELAELTAGPLIKTIVGRILKNVKIFFEKIPVEELVLE